MAEYRGRREFRAPTSTLVAVLLSEALFLAGAVMTYRLRGWTWVSIGLALASVMGLAAIVETLILRVRLTDDALEVTDLRGRRRYPRTEITQVEEGKGVPTSIRIGTGGWIKLPGVGSSLGNSIRAWLREVKQR